MSRMLPRARLPGGQVYEGWVVVAASAFIIIITMATFVTGFGTIFNPLRSEFGWSVAAMSFAFSLRSEVGGISAPVAGNLLDRYGARRVLIGGLFLAASGVLLMSFIDSLWQFYACMVIIAVGQSAASGVSGYKATTTWFVKRRGRAMALVSIGGGLSGLFVIAIGSLVEDVGWRDSLRVMAAAVLILGLPAAYFVRERPAGHPQPIDGLPPEDSGEHAARAISWGVPVRVVLRSRAFWLQVVGFAAIGYASSAFQVHQIPFAESLGVSKSVAAATVAIYGLATIVGRLGGGYLADKYDKLKVMSASMLLAAVALPMLALVTELWQIIAVYIVIAIGMGGVIPVRTAMVAEYFGAKYFGAINGLTIMALTLGALPGPLVIGLAVDATGEYPLGWIATGIFTAIAVPMFLIARPDPRMIARYKTAALPEAEPVRPPTESGVERPALG